MFDQVTLLMAMLMAVWSCAVTERLQWTAQVYLAALPAELQAEVGLGELLPPSFQLLVYALWVSYGMALALAFVQAGALLAGLVLVAMHGLLRLARWQLPPPAGRYFTRLLKQHLRHQLTLQRARGDVARVAHWTQVLQRIEGVEPAVLARGQR